jgi:hypothetical protein
VGGGRPLRVPGARGLRAGGVAGERVRPSGWCLALNSR